MKISGELEYTVKVHHEDGVYWAEVEELPGCFATGETQEELWEAFSEAVALYLSTPQSSITVRVEDTELVDQSETVEARLAVC